MSPAHSREMHVTSTYFRLRADSDEPSHRSPASYRRPCGGRRPEPPARFAATAVCSPCCPASAGSNRAARPSTGTTGRSSGAERRAEEPAGSCCSSESQPGAGRAAPRIRRSGGRSRRRATSASRSLPSRHVRDACATTDRSTPGGPSCPRRRGRAIVPRHCSRLSSSDWDIVLRAARARKRCERGQT